MPIRLSALIGAALFTMAALPAAAKTAPPRFVMVAPGVRLHVIESGAARGKPALVFLPGWTFDAEIWRREIARFSKERRVIALDPRSQGLSTKTPYGDTPEQRAKDLKAVLDRLKPGPIVLVGWSQAAQDVAAFVNAYGTRDLKGVVIVDSTVSSGAGAIERDPKGAAEQLARWNLYMDQPRDYLRAMMGFIVRKPQPKGFVDALVERSLRTPPAIGEAMLVADFYGVDRRAYLKKLDCPALIVASGYSPELDAQRAMAASLPHARIEVVEGAGHAIMVDDPDRLDALLSGFLRSLD